MTPTGRSRRSPSRSSPTRTSCATSLTGRPAFTYSRGMLVLEEYGQATGDVKRAVRIHHQGAKRNGAHLFPPNTDVLLLSNRPEDRSGVTKDFDFLINRRNQLVGATPISTRG